MTNPTETKPLSEAKLREVARTFAPVVWLHNDDNNKPSSVDWYLEKASLEYNRKETIIEVGNITAAALICQKVGSDWSDFTVAPCKRHQKFNRKGRIF